MGAPRAMRSPTFSSPAETPEDSTTPRATAIPASGSASSARQHPPWGSSGWTFWRGTATARSRRRWPCEGISRRAIRRFRPDRILTNAPLRRWERISGPSHPDHLAVGEAVTCAIYPDSRNPFAFPELLAEGLEPWVVRELWFSGGPSPDHAIDVTDRVRQKMAALRAHESQVAHLPDLEKLIRDRLTAVAQRSGLPDGRLAEAFTVLRTE